MRFFAVFTLGGLVAALCDALHVATGTIVVADAWSARLLELPLFVAASLSAGLAHRYGAVPLARTLDRPPAGAPATGVDDVEDEADVDVSGPHPHARAHHAGTAAALFIGAYLASSFIGGGGIAGAIAFALSCSAAFALIVATTRDARSAMVMGAGAAVVGTSVEATASALSRTFAYAHADFAGVPLWLPALYLLAGAAVSCVDDAISTSPRGSGRRVSLGTWRRRRA